MESYSEIRGAKKGQESKRGYLSKRDKEDKKRHLGKDTGWFSYSQPTGSILAALLILCDQVKNHLKIKPQK